MPFVAAGAVTGIGSLPLTSITSAIRSVAEFSPEVPFWPQLPQLSERESVIGQGLGIVADLIEPRNEGYGYQVKEGRLDSVLEILHRSSGELTPANAAGFGAFEEALSSGLFRSAVAVKGQIEGPITLSAYLFHQGRPFLSDPALFAAIAFHVSQIICWQIDRLKSAGLPVLLFVDEPALCLEAPVANAVSEEQRLNALAATLEDARIRGAYAGLHCCAARPFERMCRAKPDIISFDAHEGLDLFFADWHALDFVQSGRNGCLWNSPHTARSERRRFSEHLYSLAESSIPGWRSPEICSARDDHGNLRTWTARYVLCRESHSASRTA